VSWLYDRWAGRNAYCWANRIQFWNYFLKIELLKLKIAPKFVYTLYFCNFLFQKTTSMQTKIVIFLNIFIIIFVYDFDFWRQFGENSDCFKISKLLSIYEIFVNYILHFVRSPYCGPYKFPYLSIFLPRFEYRLTHILSWSRYNKGTIYSLPTVGWYWKSRIHEWGR